MSKLVNPVLFSTHFRISQDLVVNAGFIDPILNADTKLFIDPLLLETSSNKVISGARFNLLKRKFGDVIRLLAASKTSGDIAWRSAEKHFNLYETPQTCLGYGGASISGSSRPDSLKQSVFKTIKEIIALGEDDPQIISLMGMLEDGFGPDTISDLTTNMIMSVLSTISEEFAVTHSLKTTKFPDYDNRELPANPFRQNLPVLLVPHDVLRVLPIANDWDEVSKVIHENERIRSS